MTGSRLMNSILCGLVTMAPVFAVAGCSNTSDTPQGETGSLSLDLVIGDGTVINEVDWEITSDDDDMEAMSGTINTSAPGSTASVEVFGLPPSIGKDYTITMEATATDGETMCRGSEDFGIDIGEVTEITVMLNCKRPQRLGAVRVNGEFNICAELAKVVVSPLQTSVGNDIDLSALGVDEEGDPLTYAWSAMGGSIDDSNAQQTTYTCEEVGKHDITILVTDNDVYCTMATWTVPVTCVAGDGPECIDDEDCGLDEICVDFECVPDLGCTDDEDCDEGEVCNDNNQCVPDVECNDDQDCDTGFVCENFECVPDVECNENDDCDLGDICRDNVCRADPDLFCDTGLCVEDTELRGECVEKFLLCLADNVDEEECVVLSLALCIECTEDADCSGPVELTTNGGFETGDLGGWTQFCDGPNNGTCAATMAQASTGDWSGNVATAGAPANPLIKQANIGVGTVAPNSPISISFDLYGSFGPGGVVFAELISEFSGGGGTSETLGGGPLFPSDTWTTYSYTTTTGNDVNGGVTLQLAAVCGAVQDCTVDAYFDNVSVIVESSGVCNAGVCEPNPECVVDGDCPATGNECIDPVCNAGTCGTSNNTNACDGGAGTCNAGTCEPNAEVVYSQDFNQLDITGGVIGDNWFFFNNVFDEAGNLKFSYNNPLQLAPNATIDPENIFISALVNDQGGAEQDPQQLSVFSDYNCCGTNEGHQPPGTDKVEVNVLRDVFTGANPIAAGDIGKTLTFAFQAKRGNIEPPTTALGYIKTLDPNAGFSQTNFVIAETTNVGTEWTPFTISLPLDNALLVGQILQIGFQNTASDFAGSGVFYDNVLVTLE